ncbi:hypothetical protein PHYBOEH_005444 [Phytophthora boehmeriae]|uniref:Uncharacterized protein n=1 Tax=Phytophthora boehmeriae TaxID=109152 RepID=A0A8T1WLQ5_9STRA|nr:hypothetical protein PHYBOEH_005444 [Phytophthora boehmeriae]
MCARTSSLSEAQVESAEQAVIMFVAKMHKVASNEDAQAKESMVRALINDTVALRGRRSVVERLAVYVEPLTDLVVPLSLSKAMRVFALLDRAWQLALWRSASSVIPQETHLSGGVFGKK